MKQDIKIPEGYKNSSLGVIPEEWEIKKLGEIFKFIRTNSLSRIQLNKHSGEIFNIHYGDVLIKFDSILNVTTNNIPYINKEVLTNYKSEDYLIDGDIIIADTAEDKIVGKACEIIKVGKNKIVSGLHTICVRPQSNIFSPLFSGYFINSEIYHKQLNHMIQGVKVCAISKQAIKKTFFLIPPLPEQQKIAEILTTWDKAIEKQIHLIYLLEQRKHGLMQQLLTGKKRLKGFTDKWETVKLGDIGKFVSGCGFAKIEQEGKYGIPFYKVSDMNKIENRNCMVIANNYVTQEQILQNKYNIINEEAIIFAKVGAAIFLERKRIAKDFLIDNNMMAFIPYFNVQYAKL